MNLAERITALSTHIATIVKSIAVAVDKKADKENWFTLATGFLTNENLPDLTTGSVMKYTYQGSKIRYRFIAFDGSEDSFYINYENGLFSDLVASKLITL